MFLSKYIRATAVAAVVATAAILPAKADEQYFPLQSYRVGPMPPAVPAFSAASSII
jgi:branched-chain amino acid transport system substrate-binding protein